jgi:hypothetical protein
MALGLAFARKLMKIGAEKALGFNRMVDLLDAFGLKYKWSLMRFDYSRFLKVPSRAGLIKFIPRSYRPTLRVMVAPREMIKTAYRYWTKTTFFDPFRKEVRTFRTPFSTDRLRIVGRVQEEARSMFREIAPNYAYEWISTEIERVEARELFEEEM